MRRLANASQQTVYVQSLQESTIKLVSVLYLMQPLLRSLRAEIHQLEGVMPQVSAVFWR